MRLLNTTLQVEKDETITAQGATPVQPKTAQGGQQ